MVKATPEQQRHIHLLSDGDLYRQAMTFARQHQETARHRTTGSQLQGLLQFSRSWGELDGFVKHQKSKEQAYKTFYEQLHSELNQIRNKAKSRFVPDNLTKKQSREQVDFFAGLLAREFIQHLAAEMMWKEANLP